MPDANDMDLVREFGRSRSEAAFGELVRRHINLVYSVALRVARDHTDAQDIAQTVFITLARKAPALRAGTILSGWLYETTRYTALNFLTGKMRRTAREQEASMKPDPIQPPSWEMLAPQLEGAMGQLGASDRTLLVLRFYENKTGAEVAGALGIQENTAHKRTARALERLRAIFAKRGVTLTAAAIASAVAANAIQAAPVGLALSIKTASLAVSATGTFTLFKLMNLSNLKLGISAIVIAGAAAAIVVQHSVQARLQNQNDSLQQQLAQFQSDNAALSNQLAAPHPKAMNGEEFNELLKLRGEVGLLRKQVADADNLRAENQRLQLALKNPSDTAPSPDAIAQQQKATQHKVNYVKECLLSLRMYVDENQQQYPTNLDFLSAVDTNSNLLLETESTFNFVYPGSATNISRPGDIIVLVEKQSWPNGDGSWSKIYGFADGHVELQSASENDFTYFENQHLIPPAPGK